MVTSFKSQLVCVGLLVTPLLLYAAEPPGVDAKTYGCVADYRRVRVAISSSGLATQIPAGEKFQKSDVGKMLIIEGARLWSAYSADQTPLNARIASVDSDGVATLIDIDDGQRGAIAGNPSTVADFFTDNTDAIAAALHEQITLKRPHVSLPEGTIGICPPASKTWREAKVLDSSNQTRALFVMTDGNALVGKGREHTALKLSYFGDFEPFIKDGTPRFRCSPLLFLFEPQASRTTHVRLEGFRVEFPSSPVIMSGYTFAADTWNTAPPRHAIDALLRDLAIVDPLRNTRVLDSSYGGIYDVKNRSVAESIYRFENCDFETGGGCSIKNQNDLTSEQFGGKQVHLKNVVFRGGGNIVTRHYLDCAKMVRDGEDMFLEVTAPNFSWHHFNAHSDQGEGPFQPWCRIRKSWQATITRAQQLPDGSTELTLDTPSPATKTGCTLLINFAKGDHQIYAPELATIERDSSIVKARMDHHLPLDGVTKLIGAPVRVYYAENLVHAKRVGITPRRIKVDPAQADDFTLLGEEQLDLTVNTPEKTAGAFGHTFYVGANVSFFVDGMQVHDCAKRSFRVSGGGSQAARGDHELIGYEATVSRGMAALANNGTTFQPAEEFSGKLKMRRSKASSVYAVTLDMDDHSTYIAQGGIIGPSLIRNSIVAGGIAGPGQVEIEDSQIDITLMRLDDLGNRSNSGKMDERCGNVKLKACKGTLGLQNGQAYLKDCDVAVIFWGDPTQYEQWKEAIAARFVDCRFLQPVHGLHGFSAAQRLDFTARMKVERTKSGCSAIRIDSTLPLPP